MSDNVISYIEMCRREGLSLQAGMNFGVGGTHSVILMSVRVYEKIKAGIWSDNGIFHLVAWTERDERRVVYKFRLEAVEGEEDLSTLHRRSDRNAVELFRQP